MIRRHIAVLASALVSFLAADAASAQGRTEFAQSAPSPLLGRPIPYAVYIPAQAPEPGERWPVLYLLHGWSGRDGDWFTWGNLSTILDRMTESGAIPPMLVVAPGAGDSWYVDNPDPGGLGRIEAAITSDLIEAIDKRFPTAACRDGRAIGGVSMGGYGAILLALRHPDLFRAAIGLSSAIADPMRPGDPRLQASFVQDLYKGAYGDPIDPDRFNANNLFRVAEAEPAGPVRPEFWLAIGKGDYPELISAGRRLAAVLKRRGFVVEQRGGEGRHFWDYWQKEIEPALLWLAPKLSRQCA